jgi:glutamate-1-semialdehyde aminotransferase
MTLAFFRRGMKRVCKVLLNPIFQNPPHSAEVKQYGVRYLDSQIPTNVVTKTTYGASICVENSSNFVWRRHHPEGTPINLIVRFDNQVISTVSLPRDYVLPGEQVTLHFPLRIPDAEGLHELIIDLIEQNVSWFSEHGVKPFRQRMTVSQSALGDTNRLLHLANQINPWYYQPSHGIHCSREGTPFPLFVTRAKGCHVWDSEYRQYIDYIMGWGCSLLGYADERVQSAIRDVLETGAVAPFPYPLEMEVAQMLTEDFPCAEMVVFGKNGSDVCSVAARLARAYTGKHIILCSGYHGWQDFWVERMGFAVTGIPDRPQPLIHAFKFNDLHDFKRLYQIYRDDLAAVMLEPAGPAQSIQGHFQDADPAFLTELAQITRATGALLIFDEIVTGYRYPSGSVQKAIGVTPDLTCLGKAIAAGMPLSALVGRAHIFQRSMAQTHYGPTFKGELYSFAAAKAAIRIYRTEPISEFVWNYGTRLQQGINALCGELEVEAQCMGPPFRMGLVFDEPDLEQLQLKRTLYHQELLKAGILTYNGIMLPSYAHHDGVLDETLEGIQRALKILMVATQNNSFHQLIEIPLL